MNHTDTDLPETTPEEIDEFDPEILDPEMKVYNFHVDDENSCENT
jgi:hypothetical protein